MTCPPRQEIFALARLQVYILKARNSVTMATSVTIAPVFCYYGSCISYGHHDYDRYCSY
jgi:hypothetical protein